MKHFGEGDRTQKSNMNMLSYCFKVQGEFVTGFGLEKKNY
jgi:hypoxanthine-guanine phosphoribosyltransferase